MSGTRLCALDDVADGGSAGFTVEAEGGRTAMFVVRRGDAVFGYVNACPHIGAPLNFLPDVFLNLDKTHIQCSTHGALFDVADGTCVSGPCKGQRLKPVGVTLRDGTLFVG